jgi:Protein of unknown function (DUF3309)
MQAQRAAAPVGAGCVTDCVTDCVKGPRMSLLALIIVIVVLLAVLPTWPYSAGWGYYPSSGLGIVLVIVVVLLLTGRL